MDLTWGGPKGRFIRSGADSSTPTLLQLDSSRQILLTFQGLFQQGREYPKLLVKLKQVSEGFNFPRLMDSKGAPESSFHRAVLMRRLLSNSFFMQTSFSLQSVPLSSVRDYLRLTPLPPIVKEFVARYYSPLHKGHEGLSTSPVNDGFGRITPCQIRFRLSGS
jgi:hypothetical protein